MQSVSGLDNAEGNAGSEHVTTKKNDKVDRIFRIFTSYHGFYVGVLIIAPLVPCKTPHWLKGLIKTSDIRRMYSFASCQQLLSSCLNNCIDHSSINESLGERLSDFVYFILFVLKDTWFLRLLTLTWWYWWWEISCFLADCWSISDQVISSITLKCTDCVVVYFWFSDAVCVGAR